MATAKAMLQAVEAHYAGQFELELSDLMQDLGKYDKKLLKFDQKHKADWQKMLKYPASIRFSQRVLDSFPKATVHIHRLFLKRFAKLAAEKLNQKNPNLIVANHGWLTIGLTLAQRKYGLKSSVLTFATEPFDASALWADWQAEHFVAPSISTRKDLIRLGVPENKIDVVGYPVQQTFLQTLTKAEARAKLKLTNHYTCLVSLGGEGISTNIILLINKLLEHPLKPQILVIAGRNHALLAKLQAIKYPQLHPKGFVNNMVDYLTACDVVIGKAGPASVMEALAIGRQVLVTSYAGLNELKLCRFLEKESLGQRISIELLPNILSNYLQPSKVDSTLIKNKLKALDFVKMATNLADYIATYSLNSLPKKRIFQEGFEL